MVYCCAYGCNNKYKNGNEVSFHTFPKDNELRKKWVIALKRKNFSPTANSRLCSKHFKTTDRVVHFGQKKLRNNTVPSIFDLPEHTQKVECPSRSPLKRIKLSETEDCVTSSPTQEVDNFTQVIGDQTQGPTYTPENTPSMGTSNVNHRQPTYFGDFKEKSTKGQENVEIRPIH